MTKMSDQYVTQTCGEKINSNEQLYPGVNFNCWSCKAHDDRFVI